MAKRSVFIVTILLLLNNYSFTQEGLYKLEDFGLLGKVESVGEMSQKPALQMRAKSTLNFNDFGYLTNWSFDMDGGAETGSGSVIYDDKFQIVEEQRNDGSAKYSPLKNTYNEGGYITEQRIYLSDGSLEALYKYIYNDNMQVVVKTKHTDPENNPESVQVRYTYRYNAQGLVIEITEKWDDFENVSKFSYDAKGLCIQAHYSTTRTDAQAGDNFSVFTTYNEVNQVTEILRKGKDGKMISKETFVYDHRERLTRHDKYDAKGNLVEYTEYSDFDEHDNWQQSMTYQGKKIYSAVERVLTYY